MEKVLDMRPNSRVTGPHKIQYGRKVYEGHNKKIMQNYVDNIHNNLKIDTTCYAIHGCIVKSNKVILFWKYTLQCICL